MNVTEVSHEFSQHSKKEKYFFDTILLLMGENLTRSMRRFLQR